LSLSSPFIHRPVGTTLFTLAIALVGVIAFFFLPVAPLPQIDFPTINVSARLPGASPETMASTVATPLERQFGRIAGITEMTSTSTLGSTTITIQFDLDRNIDAAAREVQAAINAAAGQLPSNLPTLPSYRKSNPSDAPIMVLALTSKEYDRGQMYDYASTILQQKVSQVEGVGQIFIGGGALPAVRVLVNPTAVNKAGLGLGDVRTALTRANANRPKGQIHGEDKAWEIATNDQLFKAREYEPLIISYRDGAAIRLRDVAEVIDSVENTRTTGLMGTDPSVTMMIRREPGANIIETVDRIKAVLPQLKASIPPTINLQVSMDGTRSIRASVEEVERTLVISVMLVIMVVFVFLRDVRSTFIPSVAVPVSLIGTFAVMYFLGFSLNNLTLMALTIATGFVVDDAIVVVENIKRHIENGIKPFEAALRGAREIGFTVLSMSISLIAVFIPILLMGGIVGRLFREFAVTLSSAIAISLLISLTATPMLCAVLLKPEGELKRGKIFQAGEKVFSLLLRGYDRCLTWVLRHQFPVLLITLGTVALTIFLYTAIPKGFFPQQDGGRLSGTVIADQDVSSQYMRTLMRSYAKITAEDPAVENSVAFSGGRGTANNGSILATLKDRDKRDASAEEVVARLRKKLSEIPGASLFFQISQDLRIGGRSSGGQYQYTLQGSDFKEIVKWAPQLMEKMKTIPGIVDVNSDQQVSGRESRVVIDRDAASRLGISANLIDQTLYDAFGQNQVSTMYTGLNQYHVVMEVKDAFSISPESLRTVYVRPPNREPVPLASFARVEQALAPLSVNHQGQFPAITLSFNLLPGHALGDAVVAIQAATQELGMPATIRGTFAGTARAFQDSLASQPLLVLAALVAVYLVLGILYESLIHPITILSTLPSAGVGALLALMLCRTDLSVIALIGIILLIGIVKKNAIIMIDFALHQEREEGKSPADAIYQACLLRFRPIMMTTMAALLGGLPLALGTGVGSELRRPLGIAIVGGLIFSQMLTLFTTPVVYLYFDRLRLWLNKKRGKISETPDFKLSQ
jgi:multidrug efflux pump